MMERIMKTQIYDCVKENNKSVLGADTKFSISNVAIRSKRTVFNLRFFGICLFNLSIAKTKDGKEFISCPADQGIDGVWYNRYNVYLSTELQAKIIADVHEQEKLIRQENHKEDEFMNIPEEVNTELPFN